MSIIPFPGLHPGLVCVDPLGQTGAGAHGWSTACAGRRITHPCRNGAFMPTVPIPACMPTVPVPGLHPGLVCVDPLGQTGAGAFSRRRWRRRSGQRWTRHGPSRTGDSQLSGSVARCCGGRCGFWSAEAAAGSRSISQSAALPSAVMQGSNDRLSVRATPGRVAAQKATAAMVRWLAR